MRIIVRLENGKMPKTDNGLIISLLNASRQKTEKHRILSDLNMIVIAGLYISQDSSILSVRSSLTSSPSTFVTEISGF